MKAFGLVLLVVGAALSAPVEETKRVKARQVTLQPFPARQQVGYYKAAPQVTPFYNTVAQPVIVTKKIVQAAPAVLKLTAAPAPVPVAAPAPVPVPVFKGAVAPGQPEPFHVIVKQAQDNNFDGTFAYSYETDHGIVVQSNGFLKNAGTDAEVQVIQGSYTYYTPEGVPIITTYIADENGFQVQGDHLPVAPPVPEEIARSVAYLRSLPPKPDEQ